MEDTENKTNLVTFKIAEDDLGWAEKEQRRLKRPGERKPTQAALFSKMRSVYEKRVAELPTEVSSTPATEGRDRPDLCVVPQSTAPDPELQAAVDNLTAVRDSGDPELWGWISGNLTVFARDARRTGAKKRGHGTHLSGQETEGSDYEEGVDALLREAGVPLPGDQGNPKQTQATGTGGAPSRRVARQDRKPADKRGKG